ncbi:MAG: hypothetical protein E2O44_07400 [Nitrospina sp.]|nr:MAG: hypothetical protein E2O44_07400 [Nitrospina sp.]
MNPFRYFLGRALQFLGLITITYVVLMFFSQMGMEPLLIWSTVGIVEFYGGTLILGKSSP